MSDLRIVQEREGKDVKPILGAELIRDASSSKAADSYGVPRRMEFQDPLRCGCMGASLTGIGKSVNGQIEADYQCDYRYHHYIVFQLREKPKKKKAEKHLDKFGNIVQGDSAKATALEDF